MTRLFAESLGLDPDEVLSEDRVAKPHRTIVGLESRKIDVLNEALKQICEKELKKTFDWFLWEEANLV